jgi:hypothetical protein
MDVFSTITSPLFSEVVIVLENRDISGLPMQVTLFEMLRAMTRIRVNPSKKSDDQDQPPAVRSPKIDLRQL